MEKKDTGLGQITDKDSGQPIKKKLKLDRSALNSSLSKPTSNGVKPELKQHSFHDEKRKHDRVNSPLNSSIKKEVSPVIAISPAKIPSIKPPAPDDSDDDDVPLVARANAKLASHPHNQKVTHSVNSESMKSKSDHAKSSKESHKHSTSSGLEKKIKSDSASAGSVKVKVEGVKKVKSDSNLSLSSKVDGVKKLKSESGISKSPKISGDKKIKSESGELKPPKFDGANKVKSEGGSLKSPKVDGEKKVRSDGESLKSPQVDIERKIKSESGLLKSLKVDGEKKVKTSSGLMSPKLDGIQKIKTESDSSGSPKVEGEKKIKVKSDSQLSSKVEGVKKVKSEKTEGEKKLKPKSDKVDGVKKIKTENGSPVTVKTERVKNKFKSSTDDSDDDVPLAARVKVKKDPGSEKKLSSVTKSKERKRKTSEDDDDDDDDYKPLVKAKKKSDASEKRVKKEKTKDKKKEKDKTTEKEKEKSEAKPKKSEEEVWKWWEEEKHPEGIKWLTLEHKGPYFPPPYEPLPDDVNFYYDGKKVKLSEKSEEVAGFYAKMLEHDYTSKKIFNDNFFEDWRKEMSDEERRLIKDLSKCNFKEIHAYYDKKNEERKNMSKEEKQKLKENNEVILQEYGFCIMDGHKERVGNFKIEPPGLFRGRGDHPKQGKLKKRVRARDVTINIGKDSVVPSPPEGQKWKAISHDNKVTWLACWIENIQGSYKYVMLNPTSRIKGEKDWQKYETARKLKGKITKIRSDYTNDWKSKEMRLRQRGVALYFIDKLALRAGHEKDEDTADTVGCCSLRVEHIKLHRQMNDKEYVVEFDFLGKDSIHYHNLVEVEKRVFKNLELFKQGKTDGDDLFDRLSTTSLNKYLSELMEGLSAKVFRTYNASMTLQDQLNKLELEDNVAAKVLGYNRANRAVAILCNHQRSVPKSFEQSMTNLQQKIEDKRKAIKDAKKELKEAKAERKSSQTAASEKKYERKKSAVGRLQEQLFKLEVTQTDKEENKEIALGTSKLNYLDPRISIAWCRKNDVPIEKIYNKTQRQKFAWAIDMTEEDFEF